jgi:NhaD family Na+/H+ antiporter|tara:strand:- start:2715 stop:4016 length:1302 start_codon:yes stop_codon:yes gene_type:complete
MEINLTTSYVGILSLITFIIAYAVVMVEEFSHLRKSKPVILSAAIIWAIIAFHFSSNKDYAIEIEHALEHNILEFAELFLFLLVAMTYINSLEERKVFDVVRYQLTSRGFSFRQLFIFTGIITFFLSPIADNLTTALVMCSVLMACGKGNAKFISIGCINIVVAANAGGAYSPFGDITTLMVWQAGIVEFFTFFKIFFPSVINYVIPAAIMYFFIPKEKPEVSTEKVYMKRGGRVIIFLGFFTIFSAVNFHNILHLPPMLGMMFGMGLLGLYSFYLQITHDPSVEDQKFDFFRKVARAEWDTLLFFFGVILSVGGLGFIGYLSLVSEFLYVDLGPTLANSIVGILSAIVDNIPVMFAVITMRPEMSTDQWLLVTLTTGVGGSLLSIGSAAGVALMGQARGYYTFFGHLKWTPVIFLGYVASIYLHVLMADLPW